MRFHPWARQDFIFRDVGKQCLLIRQFGFRIVRTLHVSAQETFEFNCRTGHLKHGAATLDLDRRFQFARVDHLAGDRTFPDQTKEPKLVARKLILQCFGQRKGMARGPNRLMSLLGVTDFIGVGPRRLGKVTIAVFGTDQLPRSLDGDLRQRRGIGPHVGDMTVFVEALRGVHGPPGREPQLTVCLLLQCARGKGRFRLFTLRLDCQLAHSVVGRTQPSQQFRRCIRPQL